jgi:periplasmic protein TonB
MQPFICIGQEGENPLPWSPPEPAYDIAPQFPGGPDALNKYFSDSIQYPEPEKSKGIQGYVMLKFEVSKKGEIINVQPVNGVPGGPNLVKEAIRVMLMMPKWIPATKNGKRVQAEYHINVPFKL